MALLLVSVVVLSKTLIGVAENWPPFEYYTEVGGKYIETGRDLLILKAVLKRMGYDLKVMWLPWVRCLEMMKTKKADILLDAAKTKERTGYLYFPDEPVSVMTNVFFFLKDRKIKFDKPDDIKGLTVAYIEAYYYEDELKKLPVKLERVYDLDSAFRMLLKGRVDLVIDDVNVGLFRARQLGIIDKIDYIKKPVTKVVPLYMAFAKKPGYDKLAEEFSEELKKFKKTEEYFKIIKNYGLIKLDDMTLEK